MTFRVIVVLQPEEQRYLSVMYKHTNEHSQYNYAFLHDVTSSRRGMTQRCLGECAAFCELIIVMVRANIPLPVTIIFFSIRKRDGTKIDLQLNQAHAVYDNRIE
jgi:hypothetical protein